ncbi:MAG: efflux RND transporter periplasmic adaptor subunit [Gammaproteobacteria bacterium]|nr:MAG: efflux RND transporter periplasmic adaptor subunit [Gammaproteobacteria bacterium]
MLPAAATALGYDCLMEPHRTVEVKSAIDGRIEVINVERSDFVTAGQPLVVFESDVEKASVELARAKTEMKAEYNSSKVSHRFAVRKLGRFDGLAEEGVVAVQTKDEVETEAALARLQTVQAKENKLLAELELARAIAALDQHTVESPLTGVVVERFKSPGEYPEDSAILTLAQLDPLNVEVLLPASMFGSIKPGMKASVAPESPLDGSYQAEVKIVDRVVDASSGTFGVRLELPNPDNKLPGGLKCVVSFSDAPAKVSRAQPAVGSVELDYPGK